MCIILKWLSQNLHTINSPLSLSFSPFIYFFYVVYSFFLTSVNAEELTSPEFTATNSYEDLTYAPFRARPSSPNPWCAKVNSKKQYLQIDLGTKQSVRKIELIKRNNDTKYVKKYRIEYRVNTGGTFHKYDDNKVRVINSYCGPSEPKFCQEFFSHSPCETFIRFTSLFECLCALSPKPTDNELGLILDQGTCEI